MGASLVAQWQRIHLAMQGHRFNPWCRKIPHAMGKLNPRTLEPMLCNNKSHCIEKHIDFSRCVCVFLFRFLCFIDYYNILNIVPCAIQ